MYTTILFDLDGTITESGEGITKSVAYALEKLGKPVPPIEELSVFVGPPLKEQFIKYANLTDEEGDLAVAFYRERYEVTGIWENHVYDGLEDVLNALMHKGYRLAVASSKPEKYVCEIIKGFNLAQYFDVIAGSEMDGKRTDKQEVISEVLRRMNLESHPDQVVMVGDTEFDIRGAASMHMDTIGVTYGYGKEEAIRMEGPTYIAETPADILTFFSLSPFRLMSLPMKLWRINSPALLHFAAALFLVEIAALLYSRGLVNDETYSSLILPLNALGAVIAMLIGLGWFKKDETARKICGHPRRTPRILKPLDIPWLLALGGGLAMAGNIITSIIMMMGNFSSSYNETFSAMTGHHTIIIQAIALGILAPAAEEVLFRWLIYLRLRDFVSWLPAMIINGLIFGIFHGNLSQFIYASMLGMIFAFLMERTHNLYVPLLLHVGANLSSLLYSTAYQYIYYKNESMTPLLLFIVILLVAMVVGLVHYGSTDTEEKNQNF